MVLYFKVCFMTKSLCYLGDELKLLILRQIAKSFSVYDILYLGVLNTYCNFQFLPPIDSAKGNIVCANYPGEIRRG